MKQIGKGILLIMIVLSLVSCSERTKIRRTLREFESKQLSIPECMIFCPDNTFQRREVPVGMIYIIYFPPEVCNTCAISHLDLYSDFCHLADSCGFTPMIILSPNPNDIEDVIQSLKTRFSDIPVWLDADERFRNNNDGIIPTDSRFHAFLLNESHNPVFVGDPSIPSINDILIKCLNNNSITTNTKKH